MGTPEDRSITEADERRIELKRNEVREFCLEPKRLQSLFIAISIDKTSGEFICRISDPGSAFYEVKDCLSGLDVHLLCDNGGRSEMRGQPHFLKFKLNDKAAIACDLDEKYKGRTGTAIDFDWRSYITWRTERYWVDVAPGWYAHDELIIVR